VVPDREARSRRSRRPGRACSPVAPLSDRPKKTCQCGMRGLLLMSALEQVRGRSSLRPATKSEWRYRYCPPSRGGPWCGALGGDRRRAQERRFTTWPAGSTAPTRSSRGATIEKPPSAEFAPRPEGPGQPRPYECSTRSCRPMWSTKARAGRRCLTAGIPEATVPRRAQQDRPRSESKRRQAAPRVEGSQRVRSGMGRRVPIAQGFRA